jgi:hypothetical protein
VVGLAELCECSVVAAGMSAVWDGTAAVPILARTISGRALRLAVNSCHCECCCVSVCQPENRCRLGSPTVRVDQP